MLTRSEQANGTISSRVSRAHSASTSNISNCYSSSSSVVVRAACLYPHNLSSLVISIRTPDLQAQLSRKHTRALDRIAVIILELLFRCRVLILYTSQSMRTLSRP